MNKQDEGHQFEARLRWRAEEIARAKGASLPDDLGLRSPEEMRNVIHELRVHQLELKMQNEELRRTQVELNTLRSRYFDLYDLAPVGYCIISVEGLILEANFTAVNLLGAARAAIVKQSITRFILKEDQDIYYLHRKELFESGQSHSCELRMVKSDGNVFWACLTATVSPTPLCGVMPGADSVPVSRVVMNDITERRQLEAEKAKVEALLKAQLELTHAVPSLVPKAERKGGRKDLRGNARE